MDAQEERLGFVSNTLGNNGKYTVVPEAHALSVWADVEASNSEYPTNIFAIVCTFPRPWIPS